MSTYFSRGSDSKSPVQTFTAGLQIRQILGPLSRTQWFHVTVTREVSRQVTLPRLVEGCH